MRVDSKCLLLMVAVVLIACLGLTACGGNSAPKQQGPAPTFGTNPVLSAAEGQTYTYQMRASDWAGSVVTFSLTQAPAGAKLSNDTITWVPTAEQSRKPNAFTVVATTALGGKATQSWSVEPTGIIHVSWIDTYWDESGSTKKPVDWTPIASLVTALVPLPAGGWQTLHGAVGSTGTFDIPGVPSGYYWLRISPRATYWTSTTNFDFGSDYIATTLGSTSTSNTTTMKFNFTGLEPTEAAGMVEVDTDSTLAFASDYPAGANTFSLTAITTGNIDFSRVKTAYAFQFKPTTFGSAAGWALGPSLKLSNVNWINGATNDVTGALTAATPSSLNLGIKGSAWVPLFDHVAPGTVTPAGTSFALIAQPYVTDGVSSSGPRYTLFTPGLAPGYPFVNRVQLGVSPNGTTCYGRVASTSSGTGSGFTISVLPPPILSDQDFGTVQYDDPFPSAWKRIFSICQQQSIDLPVAGSSNTATFLVTNGQSSTSPSAPVSPVISAVQNPKINGGDLFTAATINPTDVTLSWSKPALGNPTGYAVEMLATTTPPSGLTTYGSAATLGTANTSLRVPPDLLIAGKTYVFVVTALSDAKANMETAPNRHALPFANADVISAPITVSGAAQ